MGNSLHSLYTWAFPPKPVKIVMISLDGAGKTSILYQLKLGELVTTIPTIGFCVETVTVGNISFEMWDLGGGDKIRPLHRHYIPSSNGIILVVDSADVERFPEVRAELHRNILEFREIRGVPLLVFANKQDLPGAVTTMDIEQVLKLDDVKDRRWHVEPCSAKTGLGLELGLEWLGKQINN